MITFEDFKGMDAGELLFEALASNRLEDRLAAIEAAHAKTLEDMGHGLEQHPQAAAT